MSLRLARGVWPARWSGPVVGSRLDGYPYSSVPSLTPNQESVAEAISPENMRDDINFLAD